MFSLAELPTRILIAALGFAITVGTSFIGGCEYRKRQDAKEAKVQEAANVRAEVKDAAQGASTITTFKATEAAYQQGLTDALAKAAGKPLVITKTKVQECPAAAITAQDPQPTKEPVNVTEATDPLFSSAFMQLYDSTLQPQNPQFRDGAYDSSATIRVTEGSSIIARNNSQCAAVTAQLNALISRIEDKQKIYKASSSASKE